MYYLGCLFHSLFQAKGLHHFWKNPTKVETPAMSYARQCPNCGRWFTKVGGIKRHLTACNSKNDSQADVGVFTEGQLNPLQSIHLLDRNVGMHKTNNQLCDYIDIITSDDNDVLFDDHDFEDTQSFSSNTSTNDTTCDLDDYSYDGVNSDNRNTPHIMDPSTTLQIRLNDLINNHKASLKLHDDIVNIFNDYISSPSFDQHKKLIHRKHFMRRMEKTLNLRHLRPKLCDVQLHDNSLATVPIFDAKSMILDLLNNPTCMSQSNFAEGYDVLTGLVDQNDPANQRYGEVHTGDAWMPARNRYCPDDEFNNNMPVALIVFGDKTHTDLHGALSVTPIIFTLTMFNRSFRNNSEAWRPLAYIPNLSYGKNKADKTKTALKIQDEHTCLSVAFKSIRAIHKNGGFKAVVMGKEVCVKVWIHYFIGDTEGFNKWLGHYPGNRKEISRPYRDCKCTFAQLSNPNPTCEYVTMDEMRQAKRLKIRNENEGSLLLRKMSRYDIDNAFFDSSLPLSDLIHGPNRLMPPELLHVGAQGLIIYMFDSIRMQIGCGIARDNIDKQHIRMAAVTRRQSERDFPRGATRNGLVDGTKCQAAERKGNLFYLLCIAQTIDGSTTLQKSLKFSASKWKRWIKFLKLYLSMEEWFHDRNEKEEVILARPLIAKVLTMLQQLFPREDASNQYNIPKMHAMTKLQSYIMLFGSAMNFFGGPGEAAHKVFVKAPGQKTQRRVSEFAVQTSTRYSDMMVTKHALRLIPDQDSKLFCRNDKCELKEQHKMQPCNNEDNILVHLCGKYLLHVTVEVLNKMKANQDIHVKWTTDNKQLKQASTQFCLNNDLVQVLVRKLSYVGDTIASSSCQIIGYTKAIITATDQTKTILYAHPCILGNKWYDWAYVHFRESTSNGIENDTYYPAQILGFITINGTTEAAIRCSEKPLNWRDVELNFFVKFTLGQIVEVSVVTVPLSALVHPLCVIPDYGGDKNTYIVVLPKRNWSRFFGDKIETD